jgi:glucose-6-phosphate 1-dehydrogenase
MADPVSPERQFSTMIIVGASGNLAQTKLLPALFALRSQGLLPEGFRVVGFGRQPLTDEEFRRRAAEHLTCRYVPPVSCGERVADFLAGCFYVPGDYARRDSYARLNRRIAAITGGESSRSIFYLAVPSSVFADVAQTIGDCGLMRCGPGAEKLRVVVEKPFGRDRESSDELVRTLGRVFTEDQIYRIDHYLGKEVIQNLMVLRFANLVFEPLWNRSYIRNVEISWKEDFGVADRGRYFDDYGIVRDVMQNHLLQILALVAMDEPRDLSADAIRDEKVRVLRSVRPLALEDLVVGQYRGADRDGRHHPGYVEEKYVSPASLTPTCAAAVLHLNRPRWRDVPFMIRAGKALDARLAEIRVRFRPLARRLFCEAADGLCANELVIRVQPDEAIYLRIVNKVPGVRMAFAETDLNLKYESAFSGVIPDAYERLLLDVVGGDKSLFIRSDEMEAAWDVFTPALREMESRRVAPEPYDFGGAGPAGASTLAARYGIL